MKKPKFLLLTLFQAFIVFYILYKVAVYNEGNFISFNYLNNIISYTEILIFLIGYSYMLYSWKNDYYFNKGYFFIFSFIYIGIFVFKDSITQRVMSIFLYRYIKYPEEIIFILNYIFIPYIFSKITYNLLRTNSIKVSDKFFYEQFQRKISLREKKSILLFCILNFFIFLFIYFVKKEILPLKIEMFIIYSLLVSTVYMMKDLRKAFFINIGYILSIILYTFFIL